MQHDARTVVVSNSSETMDVLASVLRFSKSLSARKGVLLTFLFISSAIGGAYYVTADRVYQSEGELFISKSGANPLDANNSGVDVVSDDMPTFVKMMKGDEVIQATLKALPREHYTDFSKVRGANWERVFRARLSVSAARDTNIMTVAFRSRSPETAMVVVDTLLSEYINYVDHIFQRNTRERLHSLEEQRAEVQEQIDATIKEHARLLSNSGLLIGNDEKIENVYAESVKTLNQEYLAAVEMRNGAEERYNEIRIAAANGEDLTHYAIRMAEGVGNDLMQMQFGTDTGASTMAARLLEDVIEAEAKLADKLEYLGPNHPDVKNLRSEITTKKLRIRELPENARQAASGVMQSGLGPQLVKMAQRNFDLSVNHVESLEENLEVAKQKASELNGQLAHINSVKATLDQLRNRLDRLNHSSANLTVGEKHQLFTKIVSPPKLQAAPVSPRLSLVVVMSLFLGFAAACATVYVMDLLDDRFRSPDDLRSELGVPILAMVQRLNPINGRGIRSLHTYSRANSSESEAFRTLRTAIDFTNGNSRKLAVSSTEPGDGKTTIIANLAVAFAQSGKRTLVIDGDLRRPGLTRLFDRNGQSGLSNVLRDNRPILDSVIGAIQQSEMDNLHVLPAGPRPVNPVELLSSDRLSELLAWAETSYDQILIDAPPSLAVTDAAIIGRLVDGAVLTVRPDKNRRKLVMRASEALTSLGCRLMGVVINSTQSSGRDAYGYGYAHDDYGHDDPISHDLPPVRQYPREEPAMSGVSVGGTRERSGRVRRRRVV